MKQNKLLKIILGTTIFIIAIILIVGGVYFYIGKSQNKFKLDSNNKYQIITDMKCITMRNDGGSHTDIYYQINLDDNTVTKIKDDYEANIGGKSKINKTIIYTKKIDSTMEIQIKSLIDETISNEDSREEGKYNYYTILGLNCEKEIYNNYTIEKIENLLQELDEY